MASTEYILGRKKYGRPQAMLWADNPGTLTSSGLYVPTGTEIGAIAVDTEIPDAFIILSDHGRSPINISPERIEKRERMINGRMRSYHIADKLKIDLSWDMLPSRAYRDDPQFAQSDTDAVLGSYTDPNTLDTTQPVLVPEYKTGQSRLRGMSGEYTVDGGAGGVELLEWYENHKGPFWAYLSYDKYTNFPTTETKSKYNHLAEYNQVIEVYITKFDYSVVKRGQQYIIGYEKNADGTNILSKPIYNGHDFWNVSVSLEEV